MSIQINGGSGSSIVDVKRLAVDELAFVFECLLFGLLSSFEDGWKSAKICIGRSHIAEAFMISAIVITLDEAADLRFETTW